MAVHTIRRMLSTSFKPFLAAITLLLVWPTLTDAWRLSAQPPRVDIQDIVYTPFEQLGGEVGGRKPLETALRHNRPDELRKIAQDHLRHEPLTSQAIPFAAPGAPFASVGGLKQAEQVSRRDPQVQLQIAALSAKQGDLAQSLAHLDKALIIDSALSETTLPSLVPALGDVQFRKAVLRYVERPWFWLFTRKAAGTQGQSVNAANLFSELGDGIRSAPGGFMPIILNTLLVNERIREVRAAVLVSDLITEQDLDTLAPNAGNSNSALSPLTWQMTNNEAVSVSLDQRTGWYSQIEAGRSAILLERVMMFEPGRYRVEIPYAGDGDLTLRLSCFTHTGGNLGQAFGKSKLLRFDFAIPEGCHAQRWSISGSVPESAEPQALFGNGAMTVRKL